jgi:hypothetical protein
MFFPMMIVLMLMSVSMFVMMFFRILLAWFPDGHPIVVPASASVAHKDIRF